ncbi:MAG: GNAT family N-acetyltransferase [Phycisphaeraceae bacterium]|nr:GNAT family N-acetyltransferase [Phycisphaeraceae bacterium]MCW5753454.1 GNAT family N-acetyltransferase [Phycisphaeraceae bacterium]
MQTQELSIRRASTPERQLAAWLLPRALGVSRLSQHVEPSVLVAYMEGRLAGALAMACIVAPNESPAVPCALHVVPWVRRRGVARGLLAEAERLALHWGVPGLTSFDAVHEGSPEAECWAWLGFEPVVAMQRFRCSGVAMQDALAPLWKRMQARGGIPEGAKLTPLGEAPPEQLSRLRAMHLGSLPDGIEVYGESHDPDISLAAWTADGRVAGMLVCRRPVNGAVFVESRVVAPGQRNGWVNLCLMLEGVKRGMAKGATAIEFDAGPAHADTVLLARRAGGELVHRTLRFRRAIKSD